jgi:hypothetical protein
VGAYEREFQRGFDELLTRHAGELARLGWFARRRRKAELRRWVEAELSGLVRAGKLPPKRSWLAREMLDSRPPVIH